LLLVGGRLRCRARTGALTPDLKATLTAHKDEIIEFVRRGNDDGRCAKPVASGSGSAELRFVGGCCVAVLPGEVQGVIR
jgi:hypothetical protein